MAIWLKKKKKKAEWVHDRSLPFRLLPLFSIRSNDTTHNGRPIHLENYSCIMSCPSHVTLSWYFIHTVHYTAYYEAAAGEAGATEDIFQFPHRTNKVPIEYAALLNSLCSTLPPLTLNSSLGAAFLRVSWLTISTVPLPVTSNYPWLRHACSFPSLPFLPLSWFYRQQSGWDNFCRHSREITLCC